MTILAGLLSGEEVNFTGQDWSTHSAGPATSLAHPVPLLLAALSPRLLRVAGQHADGAALWMAPLKATETHIAPRIRAAAADAGRPAPRIVAGLPVAVHDDLAEARAATAATTAGYGGMPNYQRILEIGGASDATEAAILGTEPAVRAQLQGLLDADATDIWVNIVAVGDTRETRKASVRRTTDLLRELLDR